MSTSPSALTTLDSTLSSLSSTAASWYNGVSSGAPVITSAAQGQATQAAANIAAQNALTQTNPILSGLLTNPGGIFILGLGIVILLLVLFLR
jgi:hypothetical protein